MRRKRVLRLRLRERKRGRGIRSNRRKRRKTQRNQIIHNRRGIGRKRANKG
jgi:hypothetical protein